MTPDTILTLGYLNIRGQSGLSVVKQIQIQDFIKHHSCDILHLQESNIDADSFSTCDMVSSAYNIIQNNSTTGYGTASIIKSDLNYEIKDCGKKLNVPQLTINTAIVFMHRFFMLHSMKVRFYTNHLRDRFD